MESDSAEFRVAVTNSCIAVVEAVKKYDKERSPSSLDTLIFHSNDLYRLLLASKQH